jgi:hypothetical protein
VFLGWCVVRESRDRNPGTIVGRAHEWHRRRGTGLDLPVSIMMRLEHDPTVGRLARSLVGVGMRDYQLDGRTYLQP